jgi:hypothetical protein
MGQTREDQFGLDVVEDPLTLAGEIVGGRCRTGKDGRRIRDHTLRVGTLLSFPVGLLLVLSATAAL